jgi:hypothetical protein
VRGKRTDMKRTYGAGGHGIEIIARLWTVCLKNRKFNGSLQQVPLRRTGRPVVGWCGTGDGKSACGLTPAAFRVAAGAVGWRTGKGRVLGRESIGAGQVTLTGRKLPSWKGAYQFKRWSGS